VKFACFESRNRLKTLLHYFKKELFMSNLVGKTIGDYQIVEVIDDGSKALIYKGFQPNKNQYVAVKVLKPAQARDQSAVQSFNQYAKLAKSIQHPNILPVLDSGVENGIIYLVTPYMENKSVADHRPSYTDLNRALGLVQHKNPIKIAE